jgi:regulator of protease activity HflC (stomatin/prohibitin superfamily)
MENSASHHFLTVPAAICAYCRREYPRDGSAPTNLFCAGCRQSHHAEAEAEARRLREKIKAMDEAQALALKILNDRIVELEIVNKIRGLHVESKTQ